MKRADEECFGGGPDCYIAQQILLNQTLFKEAHGPQPNMISNPLLACRYSRLKCRLRQSSGRHSLGLRCGPSQSSRFVKNAKTLSLVY